MSFTFKDSFIRTLFNAPDPARELYNAIENQSYTPNTQVTMTTLDETLWTKKKNDISFIIDGKLVVFAEHQTSINNNMPLRFLRYGSTVFENNIDDKDAIYRDKLIELPRPEFYVLYNGTDPCKDRFTQRLSAAFKQEAGKSKSAWMELKVKWYNINEGHNTALVARSPLLSSYVKVIGIRQRIERDLTVEYPAMPHLQLMELAVHRTKEECLKQDILVEFWESLGKKEFTMLTGEWNLDDAIRVAREEAWEKAWEKGRNKERNYMLSLMKQGYSVNDIERLTMTATGNSYLQRGAQGR
jgi:hypothetical protein